MGEGARKGFAGLLRIRTPHFRAPAKGFRKVLIITPATGITPFDHARTATPTAGSRVGSAKVDPAPEPCSTPSGPGVRLERRMVEIAVPTHFLTGRRQTWSQAVQKISNSIPIDSVGIDRRRQ